MGQLPLLGAISAFTIFRSETLKMKGARVWLLLLLGILQCTRYTDGFCIASKAVEGELSALFRVFTSGSYTHAQVTLRLSKAHTLLVIIKASLSLSLFFKSHFKV